MLYYILHISQVGGNGKNSTKITNPIAKDDASIEGTIGNLQPATDYSIKVEAFTSGGSVISGSTSAQTLAAGKQCLVTKIFFRHYIFKDKLKLSHNLVRVS